MLLLQYNSIPVVLFGPSKARPASVTDKGVSTQDSLDLAASECCETVVLCFEHVSTCSLLAVVQVLASCPRLHKASGKQCFLCALVQAVGVESGSVFATCTEDGPHEAAYHRSCRSCTNRIFACWAPNEVLAPLVARKRKSAKVDPQPPATSPKQRHSDFAA